jgi:hypothetical protein
MEAAGAFFWQLPIFLGERRIENNYMADGRQYEKTVNIRVRNPGNHGWLHILFC